MHMWDDRRPMGIDITNFVELKPFVDDGPNYLIRVPDLLASYPGRHLKSCMIGRFKQLIEVRAVIRDTELKFAKTGWDKMRGVRMVHTTTTKTERKKKF